PPALRPRPAHNRHESAAEYRAPANARRNEGAMQRSNSRLRGHAHRTSDRASLAPVDERSARPSSLQLRQPGSESVNARKGLRELFGYTFASGGALLCDILVL